MKSDSSDSQRPEDGLASADDELELAAIALLCLLFACPHSVPTQQTPDLHRR
jgi:hypothetical protein